MKGLYDEDNKKKKAPEGYEEDTSQSPLVTLGILVGMMAVAAIICALLWHFNHLDTPVDIKNQQTGPVVNEQLVESQETPEPSSEPESTEIEETETVEEVITQDGRVIAFTACDDYVTPKEYVNLRTEPSTSMGKETVRVAVPAGTELHRIGINYEAGWSRVEYKDEILYVVTNYIQELTETEE